MFTKQRLGTRLSSELGMVKVVKKTRGTPPQLHRRQLVGRAIFMSVLSVARVQFQAVVESFKGFFTGLSHSADPF